MGITGHTRASAEYYRRKAELDRAEAILKWEADQRALATSWGITFEQLLKERYKEDSRSFRFFGTEQHYIEEELKQIEWAKEYVKWYKKNEIAEFWWPIVPFVFFGLAWSIMYVCRQ